MRKTFDHQPEKARELVGTLFERKIIFRPIETSEGSRFELRALPPGVVCRDRGAARRMPAEDIIALESFVRSL